MKIIRIIKKGFTLAEVLIVLVVVGVVASLVIPPVVNDTQDAELRTAFKSNYAALSDVTKRVVQDNGGSLVNAFIEQEASDHHLYQTDDFRDKYLQYLSYTKKCDDYYTSCNTWNATNDDYSNSNCWSKYNYPLNKNLGSRCYAYHSQAILNNGAFLNFIVFDSKCNADTSYWSDASFLTCGQITIDVNGLKGPNQIGKDIFWVFITKNNIFPQGTPMDWRYGQCNPNGIGNYEGFGCAAKVLKNEDY